MIAFSHGQGCSLRIKMVQHGASLQVEDHEDYERGILHGDKIWYNYGYVEFHRAVAGMASWAKQGTRLDQLP